MSIYQQPPPQAQFAPPPANYPPRRPSQDPYGFQQYNQQQAGFAPPSPQQDAQLIPLPDSRTSSYNSQAAPFPQQLNLSPYGYPASPALQQQGSYFPGPYASFGPSQSPGGHRPHRSSSDFSHHSHQSNHSHHSHHSSHSQHSNHSNHSNHSSQSRHSRRSHHSHKEIPERKTLGDTLMMMWDALKTAFMPDYRR